MNEQEALERLEREVLDMEYEEPPNMEAVALNQQALSVLRAAVEERDKLKGEVERLLRQLTQETDESDMWRTKAEKAEAEVEENEREILLVKGDREHWCKEAHSQQARAEKSEAELEAARPLIEATMAMEFEPVADMAKVKSGDRRLFRSALAYREKVEKKEKL